VNDVGFLKKGEEIVFQVVNVQTYAGYILHSGYLQKGSLKLDTSLTLSVDIPTRMPIMSNHTSTHILNFGLRSVLGDTVDQKGSLVDASKLRFDFSHSKPVSIEDIQKVEAICNDIINKNLQVYALEVPLEIAKTISSLRAVFGETYPNPVRVVSIGMQVENLIANPSSTEWSKYSIELCGGTHLRSTTDAKSFVIISEAGIAKGVRRIVAWTGEGAQMAFKTGNQLQARITAAKLKKGEELSKEISSLSSDVETLSIPLLLKVSLLKGSSDLVNSKVSEKKDLMKEVSIQAEEIATTVGPAATIIVEEVNAGSDRKALDAAHKILKEKCPNAAIMLFSRDENKVALMISVPKVHSKLIAGDWAKEVSEIVGGKGGGKADTASGVGTNASKIPEAIAKAISIAKSKIQ